MKVERRHDEVLLLLHLRQRLNRTHVAVVFERRRNPAIELVDQLARRIELNPPVSTRAGERIKEREVPHQPKFFVTAAGNRPKFEPRGIILGPMPHIIELDIAAELHRPLEGLRYTEMESE